MKYVAIAIIFLALGYAISLYLPPSSFNDDVEVTTAEVATEQVTADQVDLTAGDHTITGGNVTAGDLALPAVPDSASTELAAPSISDPAFAPEAPPAKPYEEGTYLTELDLLSSPERVYPLGFRVGPPVKANKADAVIERTAPFIAAVKAQYLTANNQPAVIVIAGSYEDFDAANKARATLQLNIKERLEIIYLPECIQNGTANSDGFLCAPEEPPAEPTAA